MRVRMLVSISGTRDGVEWPARGGLVDLPDAEAADMIRAGLAAAFVVEGEVETAALEAPETATTPAPKRRRG